MSGFNVIVDGKAYEVPRNIEVAGAQAIEEYCEEKIPGYKEQKEKRLAEIKKEAEDREVAKAEALKSTTEETDGSA